ncbi:hypothetical protein CcaCcLH18_02673 [Colletotrichum camelliae]|nr:hypothetical protein CcaCcLH18_02673 [Colletotrichum camelliae]
MPPPTLLSRGEGANDSRPGNEGSTKLPSRGSDTPIEELRSCSFENSRNASAHDERVAFISPSISSISDNQTLNAAPGSTASEQHHNHEAARFSEGETPSHKRERTAPPYSDKSPESVWTVWWMEIFSSFLALGCIIAMVVILSIYQGQPLPRWPKLISINSLIAVFTAIFKASLILPVAEGQLKWNWFDRFQKLGDLVIFDNASRGPWGSFLLMIKYIPRPDKGYLAGLGAFITIAALAIDPFSQAIINHRSCEVTADFGLAQVSRTNNYSGNPPQRYSPYGGLLITLNQQMLRAIHRGLVDPPKAGQLADFTCTSGNCTFERESGGSYFSSLSTCYSCDDITEKVVNVTESGPTGPTTTWHIPWSVNVTYERLFTVRGSSRHLAMRPTPPQAYQNSSPPIYSFDLLSYAKKKCDRCKPVFAAQCRIDPCVKRYSATVSNGAYAEKVEGDAQMLRTRPSTLVESWGIETSSSFGLITDSVLVDGVEKTCNGLDDKADNSVQVGFKDGAFQEIFDERNGAEKQNLTWKHYPKECVWVVERSSWFGMRQTMTELLQGDITTSGADADEWAKGSFWNKQVYANGNISMSTVNDLVAGLADSMTATMRRLPYGASEQTEELESTVSADLKMATGRVMTTETCIYVEWGWIAYPAALLALQWTFSMLVLVACSRCVRPSAGLGRAVWKSSPLALLFHGIDDDLRARSQTIDTVKQMQSLADDVRVRLVPAKHPQRNGWKFADI